MRMAATRSTADPHAPHGSRPVWVGSSHPLTAGGSGRPLCKAFHKGRKRSLLEHTIGRGTSDRLGPPALMRSYPSPPEWANVAAGPTERITQVELHDDRRE